jgi:hypothetical protein
LKENYDIIKNLHKIIMESGNNHASHENIWHQQQQIAAGDPNKQFYMNHYQVGSKLW